SSRLQFLELPMFSSSWFQFLELPIFLNQIRIAKVLRSWQP
ncbi:MAG: hypothetical protein ACJA1Q_003054, partial [Pseudohongiellaceae bacterium]